MKLVHTTEAQLDAILAIIRRQPDRRVGAIWTRIVRAHRRELASAGIPEPEVEEELGRLFAVAWSQSAAMRERLPLPAFIKRVREGDDREGGAPPARVGPFRGGPGEPRVARSAVFDKKSAFRKRSSESHSPTAEPMEARGLPSPQSDMGGA